MSMSQREAARQWGVSRSSIQRAIKSGQISKASDGGLDPAEMLRVFGEAKPAKGRDDGPGESTEQAAEVARLRIELARLRAELEGSRLETQAQREHLADLRATVQRLTGPSGTGKRRRWWPFGRE